MTNILCFGDSNTWGFDAENQCRFPNNILWSSRLQYILGSQYTVSAFGIPDMTYGNDDPYYRCCDGCSNIIPAIRANSPIDIVVVSLGVNDCKSYLANSSSDLERNIQRMIHRILLYKDLNTHTHKVILCGQKVLSELPSKTYRREFSTDLGEKVDTLNNILIELSKSNDVKYCPPPDNLDFCSDGLHYSKKGHEIFANNVATVIRNI